MTKWWKIADWLTVFIRLKRNQQYDTDIKTRMRANAQRDGLHAEYRWRPLFNAAKFS